MTATNPAIEVSGLPKSYGDHSVLDGVDLTVPEGTVYALLGPNGAGKTTVVTILSTLLTPGDGEIRVAGFDVRREPAGVRAAIGRGRCAAKRYRTAPVGVRPGRSGGSDPRGGPPARRQIGDPCVPRYGRTETLQAAGGALGRE